MSFANSRFSGRVINNQEQRSITTSSTLLYLVVTFLQNVSPFALQRQKIVLHLFMSPPLQFISSKDVFNCLSVCLSVGKQASK